MKIHGIKTPFKSMDRERVIDEAVKKMGFESSERRWSDDKDFRDVAVWNARAAVEAAYEAGRRSKRR